MTVSGVGPIISLLFKSTIDDLLGVDALCFSSEIRKHAMTQDRSRNAKNIRRRDCKSSGEKRVCFCAEYECLARAWAGSPSNVFLHHLAGIAF